MPVSRIHTMLFPGGKRKALTLSYDDGVLQDHRLIELMRKYNVKGTFNLNSALLGRSEKMEINGKSVDISTVSSEEVSQLYQGFEVATHASKHTALVPCSVSALTEILEDRKVFENLVPYFVRGHAYPFGMYDKNVMEMLKTAGILYARTVKSTHSFELPDDFLEWNPTCHHSDPDLMELIKQFCEKDALFGQPQLFYLWGHAYEFDADQNWNVIEDFLSYVSGYNSEIWMASNIEIVDYITAFRGLVYSADGSQIYNPSVHTVWLEWFDGIYEIPPGGTVKYCGILP